MGRDQADGGAGTFSRSLRGLTKPGCDVRRDEVGPVLELSRRAMASLGDGGVSQP